MKKIYIAAAIFLSAILNFGNVDAEQNAAEKYREIFRSGNFYLEYKDKWGTRILAGKNGTRMERMNYTFENGALTWLNPLGAIFGGTGDKNPEVMYKDGKYYHFTDKRRAFVCSEKNLHDENLDPRQGWNKISQKLAVPDELAVFFWDDPYRTKSPAVDEPQFLGSYKRTLDGKEYDCDAYLSEIKSSDGQLKNFLRYELFYRDGQLFRAEILLQKDLLMYPVGELEIVKIQREIPKDTFKIYNGTKLYSAGTGDIDDLLEKPKEIGIMEESK